MKKAFGIAGGAQERVANVVVTVVLADGTKGYGEAAPFPAFNGETQAAALDACTRAVDLVVGRTARDWAALAETIRAATRPSATAGCAIETAIVDAHARQEGISLLRLFGGAETRLVTDVTITTGSVDDARREAIAFAGFRHLKIKVGGGDVDHDVARLAAVRAVRPDASLLVDANGGFTPDEALRFLAACRAHDVRPHLFEQPIAAGDEAWGALAKIRRDGGVRVALDESITSVADVRRAHETGAADAVNVKISKSGIAAAIAIVREAEARGLGKMIGGMVETRLAMGTSACIAGGIGGFEVIDLDTPLFLAVDPWEGGYAQDDERLDLRPITLGHGCVPRDVC